jgi:hypothetical protein
VQALLASESSKRETSVIESTLNEEISVLDVIIDLPSTQETVEEVVETEAKKENVVDAASMNSFVPAQSIDLDSLTYRELQVFLPSNRSDIFDCLSVETCKR